MSALRSWKSWLVGSVVLLGASLVALAVFWPAAQAGQDITVYESPT